MGDRTSMRYRYESRYGICVIDSGYGVPIWLSTISIWSSWISIWEMRLMIWEMTVSIWSSPISIWNILSLCVSLPPVVASLNGGGHCVPVHYDMEELEEEVTTDEFVHFVTDKVD